MHGLVYFFALSRLYKQIVELVEVTNAQLLDLPFRLANRERVQDLSPKHNAPTIAASLEAVAARVASVY